MAGSNDSKKIILTTGYTAHGAYKFLKDLINYLILLCIHYLVGEWSIRTILKYLSKFKEIITIEDHLKDGGFGSWMLECVNESDNNQKINIKVLIKYYRFNRKRIICWKIWIIWSLKN